MSLLSHRIVVLIVVLVAAQAVWTGHLAAQDQPSFHLNIAHLQSAGLHLPSYMANVSDLMSYQVGLSSHQELTVNWNLIPIHDRPVRREEIAEGSLAAGFSILERKHNLRGSARTSTLTISDMTLITVAVTGKGEVRGLTIGPGTPIRRAERARGKPDQGPGYDVVNPQETFTLLLPDDPQIEKLVFFLSHPDGEKYRLEQVGMLDLNPQQKSAN